jgi:hypothetical protein
MVIIVLIEGGMNFILFFNYGIYQKIQRQLLLKGLSRIIVEAKQIQDLKEKPIFQTKPYSTKMIF